jgi:Glycosyl hydrolase family 30 beta sandwich domain
MKRAAILSIVLFLFLGVSILACKRVASSPQSIIGLNPTETHQKITGWEATAWVGQNDFPATFGKWKEQLLDLAVNDLGINRVRLQIFSGTENPYDYFTPYVTGQTSRDQWKAHWYEIINDDNDPDVISWTGFQFAQFDFTIDNVVLPLAERLRARGERLFINVNYVDFSCCRGSSNIRHADSPQEYAEFVLATYLHLRDKYGITPDAWEVVLEPDAGTGWTATQMGRAVAATADRLKANGFVPNFIAPSTTNMANASTYFDEMIQVPGVLRHISELSYHRYAGVSGESLQAIASRAAQHGINSSMLEHIGSGYEDLHADLKIGMNSAWSQYTIGDAWPGDTGGKYYLVDAANPNQPVVTMGSRTRFLRQYFRFIRSGAVRIGASSNNADFDPLAFINANGSYVVVIKATAGGASTIEGLPAGTFGIKYTTTAQYDIDEPDVTISEGQALDAFIPDPGVITIYAKPSSNPVDDRAIISHCSLNRNSNGTWVLIVSGSDIRAGATVTVGGAVPGKIKFKDEIGPGQGVFTRLKLKKRFCAGLPGDIVVTNPGAQPSEAFRCEASCSN